MPTKVKTIKKPGKKDTKSNIVRLKDIKETANKISKNITLDKTPGGDLITFLDHYKAKDYERLFTIDDVLLLIPKDLKKRTWADWRTLNNEPGILREDKLGPEYVIRGKKIYRIKLIWILRYLKGLKWEQEVQVQVSATQSDETRLRSSSSI